MKFVIEHLEEELFPWCIIEYGRIAKAVGRENFVVCNLSTPHPDFESRPGSFLNSGIPFERTVLLDSEATEPLSPSDAGRFEYVLAGGILGNVDEFDMDRTALLRQHNFSGRHLGHMQMTTDTAVKVAHMIVTGGLPFEQIAFVDRPQIVGPSGQQFVSDFRYIRLPNGQPDIDPRIVEEMERDFDFDQLE